MGVLSVIGGEVAKRAAPVTGGNLVRNILERAIDGAGPFPGAAQSGDAALRKHDGNITDATESLISSHLRMAAAQGFLTNVGGFVTTAVTMPVNVAGLVLLQCHLAAAILHVRGYDLAEPAVRDAVLICLLDPDMRKSLTKELGLTMSPGALVTAEPHPQAQSEIAKAVTGQLIALSGGKQIARFAARRIPVLGGAIGGTGDALSTRRIGRDAARIPLAQT